MCCFGLIEKFEAGYIAGAKAVNPDIEIISEYITEFPNFDGFNDPASGRETALAIYEQGADIINISSSYWNYRQDHADAIARAIDAGVLVVTGSGNNGSGDTIYPSAYPGVISVGATDSNNALAGFSNYGADQDFVAPGKAIFVQKRVNGQWSYGPVSGGSVAGPMVAGSLALLISAGATPTEAVQYLRDTAIDLGEDGRDDLYGHGLIQVGAAVSAFISNNQPCSPGWCGGGSNFGWAF